jgi:hypothetical protein
MTQFKSLDYEWGMNRLTKKSCSLKWRLQLGCHFLMVQIIFQFFFPHKLPDLGRLTTAKVWISQPKNPSH